MSSFLDEVTDQLNLRWAWEKVRREATPGDIWFDEVELAKFEMELGQHLQSIARDFRSGNYHLTKLRPLPFPKHDDTDGKSRVRQVFQVALRDQVAWTAIVNVIGPHVDSEMPSWSYGNRLYRTIWVDEDDKGLKRRKIGRYRHAAGKLYLPFGQSWPVFRRHVYLATCAMTAGNKLSKLDERTAEELEIQKHLPDEHRCPFTVPEYWQNRRSRNNEQLLYWCSLDFEKFYPSMKLQVVTNNILDKLPSEWRNEASQLLSSMIRFQLNLSEWTADELKRMDIEPDAQTFPHIPTGLYVAGFLANAGLLRIDAQVTERLVTHNVAHFRFVDDHIVLAYRFNALVTWVREYMALLAVAETGAKVNPSKIEPDELAQFLITKKSLTEQEGKKNEDSRKKAEERCRLDPQFPSPLMTKTLALVSGIARTNFNLLEPAELAALTDQLEHLLLVHLPEDEIPERTRLSFAATRLTQVAECRLANDDSQAITKYEKQACLAQLAQKDLRDDKRQQLDRELRDLDEKLTQGDEQRKHEVDRAFQLLRKVLRERPDRVRLWTRAILMCRLTGVKGLADLRDDIKRMIKINPLAAEYLRANILVLLGRQSLIAARILCDEDMPTWRKDASRAFLKDVATVRLEPPDEENDRWFLRASWRQYCFGIYCADHVLPAVSAPEEKPHGVSFSEAILTAGNKCLETDILGHKPPQWAWWAGSMTLRNLTPSADGLVKFLGDTLKPSKETSAFWRFFPKDVPKHMLRYMALEKHRSPESATLAGWWYDALRDRAAVLEALPVPPQRSETARAVRALRAKQQNTASLYDWCKYLLQPGRKNTDPRIGEWTALEIVRQIAALLEKKPTLRSHMKSVQKNQDQKLWFHPANFTIPKSWMEGDELPWSEWQTLVREGGASGGVSYVPMPNRIVDRRYTPLVNSSNPLFRSVNPVHGLGILLYGLLKKSFDLPSIWNGPGHADVLGMLPKLLLDDMTCSSWTLGILQGCLQPRATENLFMIAYSWAEGADNDMLEDPPVFKNATHVAQALKTSQVILEENQLSTLNHRARQLTPVNIRQLTKPEWDKTFHLTDEEGGLNE